MRSWTSQEWYCAYFVIKPRWGQSCIYSFDDNMNTTSWPLQKITLIMLTLSKLAQVETLLSHIQEVNRSKSQLRHWLSWLKFLWSSSVSPGQFQDTASNQATTSSTIHYSLMSNHLTLYTSPSNWQSLNKIQIKYCGNSWKILYCALDVNVIFLVLDFMKIIICWL
jgi:hypothetical protein